MYSSKKKKNVIIKKSSSKNAIISLRSLQVPMLL